MREQKGRLKKGRAMTCKDWIRDYEYGRQFPRMRNDLLMLGWQKGHTERQKRDVRIAKTAANKAKQAGNKDAHAMALLIADAIRNQEVSNDT